MKASHQVISGEEVCILYSIRSPDIQPSDQTFFSTEALRVIHYFVAQVIGDPVSPLICSVREMRQRLIAFVEVYGPQEMDKRVRFTNKDPLLMDR